MNTDQIVKLKYKVNEEYHLDKNLNSLINIKEIVEYIETIINPTEDKIYNKFKVPDIIDYGIFDSILLNDITYKLNNVTNLISSDYNKYFLAKYINYNYLNCFEYSDFGRSLIVQINSKSSICEVR